MKRAALLTGFLAYAVGLLIMLPAEQIRAHLETALPGFEIGVLDGNAWHGKAAPVRIAGITFDQWAWQVRPLGLLLGRLEVDSRLLSPTSGLDLRIETGLLGSRRYAVSNVAFDLTQLDPLLETLPVQLRGQLTVQQAMLAPGEDGWPTTFEGALTTKDLEVVSTFGSIGLGALHATLQGNVQAIEARFDLAHGNPLQGTGTLLIHRQGGYRLSAELSTADDELSKQLTRFGRKLDDGRFRIELTGRWSPWFEG